MALRTIVTEGDECLRKQAKTVTNFDEKLWTLLDDMADTMYEANGVGLAAPQVSVLRQVVVIDVGDGLIELVNPEVIAQAGSVEDTEGCLSFPGQWGIVARPEKAAVKAQDRHGKEIVVEGEGLLARALCHEIDHLKGVVFKDLVIRMCTEEELNG
ncbi:peptide deformylase [Clostridiaceae bacterium NSJ-31]|uniref:Peptide deformylase n=1 Tax=Ligaoa zhengdingensis TaxID=2763658 RepID=A0A926E1Q3_9FIRM|nr:peptide deformylase [Ligaoa zhengdingensis]MBC8547537.1 peptide deformylase [Ligaoa zhengdingensis]